MAHHPNSFSHPKYRPDIDGLRAIAVISVVAFHAYPESMKGGFIGVDIFFVISGFLISTIIFENLNSGTFSFIEFYARRIKRIFPALSLVLGGSLLFGWLALFADEYKELGKHVAAGAGFISNLVLWRETGYFDSAVETKPLLHLWSLGVEEQFYFVWPLVLWLAWKRKFNFFTIAVFIACVSFAMNIGGINKDATGTFYSPQTRFWEMLSGSLLAWFIVFKNKAYADLGSRRSLTAALSFLGIALLVGGFWGIHSDFHFPGIWAVVPVSGAVLIILAGPAAWLNRIVLSNRLVIWFGLISFPLYLWHWPLLSFAGIVESEPAGSRIRNMALILSIALAWLTYKFVETPIRKGKLGMRSVVVLALVMFGIGLAGLGAYYEEGFPTRQAIRGLDMNVSPIARLQPDDPARHAKCMRMYGLSDFMRFCRVSTASKPSIALIGDSHAAALYGGMVEALQPYGQGILDVGGRLFLDVATYPRGDASEIEVYKGGIRATAFAAQEKSIHTVIMVSRGSFYLQDDWVFQLISDPSVKDRRRIWEIAMRETLNKFVEARKQVVFVLDNPDLDFDPRMCVKRPFRLTGEFREQCAIPRAYFDQRNKDYRRLVFSVLRDYPQVKVFDAAAYLCDSNWCQVKRDNKILYSDRDHLSRDGAVLLSKELVKVLHGEKSKILSPTSGSSGRATL